MAAAKRKQNDQNEQLAMLATVDPGFTAVSWQPKQDMSWEQWEMLGKALQQMGASLPWWVGDWLNFGEYSWGEMYAQAIEITGLSESVLQNYKWVADKIPPERRRPSLSWSIHRVVAPFMLDDQERWLGEAQDAGYTVNELLRAIQTERLAILPPEIKHEEENDAEAGDRLKMSTVSPVRRLRYALRRLRDRHLELAPFDVDHDVVIQAENIWQETLHAENEDLDE